MTNKLEILTQALSARRAEVFAYQINIDNYLLAIAHITNIEDVELYPFREQLSKLLASELLEQKKAGVMLTVIEVQLQNLSS